MLSLKVTVQGCQNIKGRFATRFFGKKIQVLNRSVLTHFAKLLALMFMVVSLENYQEED